MPPGVLEVTERRGCTWRGTIAGPVIELVRWAAGQPLDDLTISKPDLESLFREFYQPEAGDR